MNAPTQLGMFHHRRIVVSRIFWVRVRGMGNIHPRSRIGPCRIALAIPAPTFLRRTKELEALTTARTSRARYRNRSSLITTTIWA